MGIVIKVGQVGFTVLELVLVMVLAGVLASVALPRLVGHSNPGVSIEGVAGLLRLTQLRAMNDPAALRPLESTDVTERCARLVITTNGLSLAPECMASSQSLLSSAALANAQRQGLFIGQDDLQVTASLPLPLRLAFGQSSPHLLSPDSWLGRPYVNGERLTDTLRLTINGQRLLISSEGYIYVP